MARGGGMVPGKKMKNEAVSKKKEKGERKKGKEKSGKEKGERKKKKRKIGKKGESDIFC